MPWTPFLGDPLVDPDDACENYAAANWPVRACIGCKTQLLLPRLNHCGAVLCGHAWSAHRQQRRWRRVFHSRREKRHGVHYRRPGHHKQKCTACTHWRYIHCDVYAYGVLMHRLCEECVPVLAA